MLNYNVNYIEPFANRRNFLRGKVNWSFRRANSVATGLQPPFVYGTGSILYVPYQPTTFFYSGSYETGSISSGSAVGQPIKTTITGSGVWPQTGSNVMQIQIGSNLGFNQIETLTLSQAAGNMNLSGSKISSSFTPITLNEYNIDSSIIHYKGNQYNPLINWSAVKTSPFGNTVNVNGELSASFNIIKNTTVTDTSEQFTNVAFIKEVSGSAQSSSFNNEYAFSVTASYTASINNVTGSTTMSFVCAEEGLDKKVYFFNPNTTLAIGSASFVTSNNTSHSFVTSINYYKGNINNGPINWSTTNLSPLSNVATINGYTASFNLVKDKNVSIINYPQITGSRFGTFNSDYAFNFTSSLTASIQAAATGSVTMSLIIPEAGINTSSKIFSATSAGVNIITASFDTRNENPYNITASVIFNKGNINNPLVNWKAQNQSPVTTTGNINGYTSSFNIVKDVNVALVNVSEVTSSISSSFLYQYNFGVTASLTASINNVTGSTTMSIEIPQTGVSASQQWFNETTTEAKLTGSFVATNNNPYNITASVIFNKGNISNSNIGWKISGSGAGYGLIESSSFNIRKDVSITMATASFTASVSSSYLNNYAFNQTASISSSFVPYFSSGSEFFYVGKLDLKIPEINFSSSKWISSSLDTNTYLTSSFAATTGISNYSITASVITYRIPQINYLIVGGGGGGAKMDSNTSNAFAGGGGAGGLLSGSVILSASYSYPVIIGTGGAGATTIIGGLSLGQSGTSSSFLNLTAFGGGYGGGALPPALNYGGANGGSGGANGGLGTVGQGNDYVDNIYAGGAGNSGGPITWLNGINYAGGGGGFGINGINIPYGGDTPTTIGGGGNGRISSGGALAQAGQNGTVVIRYKGPNVVATGGTVSVSGSYVYHTFTSNGTFVFDGLTQI